MFINRYVISRERLITFGYLIKCLPLYAEANNSEYFSRISLFHYSTFLITFLLFS